MIVTDDNITEAVWLYNSEGMTKPDRPADSCILSAEFIMGVPFGHQKGEPIKKVKQLRVYTLHFGNFTNLKTGQTVHKLRSSSKFEYDNIKDLTPEQIKRLFRTINEEWVHTSNKELI